MESGFARRRFSLSSKLLKLAKETQVCYQRALQLDPGKSHLFILTHHRELSGLLGWAAFPPWWTRERTAQILWRRSRASGHDYWLCLPGGCSPAKSSFEEWQLASLGSGEVLSKAGYRVGHQERTMGAGLIREGHLRVLLVLYV